MVTQRIALSIDNSCSARKEKPVFETNLVYYCLDVTLRASPRNSCSPLGLIAVSTCDREKIVGRWIKTLIRKILEIFTAVALKYQSLTHKMITLTHTEFYDS